MERKKMRWKKIGGGSFRLANGKIIKPNQEFQACPEEIPEAFRDVVRPLDPIPEDPPLDVVPGNYQVRARGSGWYDVIDHAGKTVNESALRRDEAQTWVEQLKG